MPQLQDFMHNAILTENIPVMSQFKLLLKEFEILLANTDIINTTKMTRAILAIYLDPHISSRQIERETGISKSTVIRILNARRYHVYHINATINTE